MSAVQSSTRSAARQRFQRARRQANRERMSARLTGRETTLLPFAAVRSQLRQQSPLYRGLQEVPMGAIVGSVGRYREFTRHFLPLNDSLQERWVNVEALSTTQGWPPIDLYQVGNLYFVKDGNHRVSVARQMELPTIEAHVWEFPEDISIDPDAPLDNLLIELGMKNFMARTRLDERIPEHSIRFTSPGRYTELLTQIQVLQETLSFIDDEKMPYDEAVLAWYEMIYLPTVQIIRDSGLLTAFPGRTEADLFVWVSQHRELLREMFGEYANLADLAQLLAAKYGKGSLGKMVRQVRRLLGSEDLPPLADPDLEQKPEENKE